MASASVAENGTKKKQTIPMVIGASSLGTLFEWYDFFIYGTLAASGIIGRTFFPSGSETLQTLLAWAGFAVGFGFRPLGAVIFGYLGDKLGRKYTFMMTIILMGVATAGVGLVPSAAAIGVAAPILIILLRVCQGLALGGEYGGAAIYVAEHAPPGRAGFYTSFIQASVAGGFVLSLIVILSIKTMMDDTTWDAWGWRIPFLISLVLLAISVWMRAKLSESPVFAEMKAKGETARNPFVESFTYPGNKRRLVVALLGVSAGFTVIWYTAMFYALSFLQGPMKIEGTTAQINVAVAATIGSVFFIWSGYLSDKLGRAKVMATGYVLALIFLFPIFWFLGQQGSPALVAASARAPISVTGPDCAYSPFATKQADSCATLLADLTAKGVPYTRIKGADLSVTVGEQTLVAPTVAQLDGALASAGYDMTPDVPNGRRLVLIFLGVLSLTFLAGLTYGPVAAILCEMFPPAVRYSSMSIPYHIGTGYFGGFLPFISSYLVARSGDSYAGLWYTIVVVLIGLPVLLWGPGRAHDKALDGAAARG